jgi:RNA polymerase sigma-70 factor (ECF subfamily)
MVSPLSRPALLPPPSAVSDVELVARAAAGDRWSRDVLYRRHVTYLLDLGARLLASRAEAEDVVQDAFVAGFSRLHALRDPAALRAWLTQIAVNLIRRRLRKAGLLRLFGMAGAGADAALETLASPELGPDARAELALFDRALAAMGADQRLAWMLRHVEGLELTEVAAACGCSLATVKRRIAAAEARIGQHVSRARGAS